MIPWGPIIQGAATILPMLFGGGKKEQGREMKRESTLSPEQRRIEQWLMGRFRQKPQAYGGQMRATMPGAAQGLLEGKPMFTEMPPLWQEYFKSAIETPMRTQYQEETAPGISESFVGPGTYWSSMRAGGEQKGAEEFARSLASTRAATALTAEQEAAQRVMGLTPMDIAMQETGISKEYADWLRQQPGYTPQDEMALKYLGIPTEAGYWEAEQQDPFAQILSQLAPLISSYIIGKETSPSVMPRRPGYEGLTLPVDRQGLY